MYTNDAVNREPSAASSRHAGGRPPAATVSISARVTRVPYRTCRVMSDARMVSSMCSLMSRASGNFRSPSHGWKLKPKV